MQVAFLWNLLELVYFFSSDYVSSPQPHKKHKKRKHKKHKKHRESGNGGQSSDTGQSELVEATDSLTGKPQLKLKIKIGGQTLRTKRYTLLLLLFLHIHVPEYKANLIMINFRSLLLVQLIKKCVDVPLNLNSLCRFKDTLKQNGHRL